MEVTPLSIPGAWVFTPAVHPDDRGTFAEWFRADVVKATVGRSFDLMQANVAHSRRGVLRGIHGVSVPPGQAKVVMCAAGSVLDVVVDVRLGSPTFGRWQTLLLDEVDQRAVYVSAGLGHGLMALSDTATVVYLCDAPWVREHEYEVCALDPDLGIDWPADVPPILSKKDAAAPKLAEVARAGRLPRYEEFLTAKGQPEASGSHPRGWSR